MSWILSGEVIRDLFLETKEVEIVLCSVNATGSDLDP